jgi:hypothetical protein
MHNASIMNAVVRTSEVRCGESHDVPGRLSAGCSSTASARRTLACARATSAPPSVCLAHESERTRVSITIPYFTEKSRPDSFYDKIMENQKTGSHTLVLLDIQVKEQSYENLLKYGACCAAPAAFLPPVRAGAHGAKR